MRYALLQYEGGDIYRYEETGSAEVAVPYLPKQPVRQVTCFPFGAPDRQNSHTMVTPFPAGMT